MFICDNCSKEYDIKTSKWKSYGPCEICGSTEMCSDTPTPQLQEREVSNVQSVDNILEDKFTLEHVTCYNGWGNHEGKIIFYADTKEDLIEYCEENNIDYKSSYSGYIIHDPAKRKLEEDKPVYDISEKEILLVENVEFEPPIFIKALLRINKLIEFKELFEKNVQFGKHITLNDEITIEIKDLELIRLIGFWLMGLRDPFTGISNYHGLLSNQLNYNPKNHNAELYINDKQYYLLLSGLSTEANRPIAELTVRVIPVEDLV